MLLAPSTASSWPPRPCPAPPRPVAICVRRTAQLVIQDRSREHGHTLPGHSPTSENETAPHASDLAEGASHPAWACPTQSPGLGGGRPSMAGAPGSPAGHRRPLRPPPRPLQVAEPPPHPTVCMVGPARLRSVHGGHTCSLPQGPGRAWDHRVALPRGMGEARPWLQAVWILSHGGKETGGHQHVLNRFGQGAPPASSTGYLKILA